MLNINIRKLHGFFSHESTTSARFDPDLSVNIEFLEEDSWYMLHIFYTGRTRPLDQFPEGTYYISDRQLKEILARYRQVFADGVEVQSYFKLRQLFVFSDIDESMGTHLRIVKHGCPLYYLTYSTLWMVDLSTVAPISIV